MKIAISMTIEESILKIIDLMADYDGRTRSNYIEKLLKDHVEIEEKKNRQE